ncbi:uncharacterized protein LOC123450584 [Hordeum vulgare subsp. vulgare]|nr:uncharacterized protein LOC123450584 [Hordeum vulgare subsp. vulgare]
MDFRNHQPSANATAISMAHLDFPSEMLEDIDSVNQVMSADFPSEAPIDIDMREIYFLIMHFLSHGPFKRAVGELCNELLEHQLLPRRYHPWYSRGGFHSGEENDDGVSLPLGYLKLVERYPHIGKDHLAKLLKQLMTSSCRTDSLVRDGSPNAADVPTLLGSNSFSLLASARCRQDKETLRLPKYLRWPHMHADQVHGLGLREIGGFTKNHRAPSVLASCYAIAKPSTFVEKMQIIKRLRGHQNAAYCATFDCTGCYVITGSDDCLVKIWAMETAFCLASCRGHEGDITDLTVSSNNAVVASSSNDFIIRVWRIPDGMPMSVLKGHTGAVTTIAFSPRPGAAFQLLSPNREANFKKRPNKEFSLKAVANLGRKWRVGSTSKTLLNGAPGPAIWHRRGLRQGDPLSPQLFVLAVDTLGRLLHRATELGILQQLHPRRSIPVVSLYADDVILFCHPSRGDIEAVKSILQLFGRASGLQVNFLKSSATLIRCDPVAATPVVDLLGCPIVDLPITYLGIPLTIRRPTAAQLQPVVDRTADMLPCWKARLMNKAGRLAFVKAVLSAIPIHQLLVLAPPKKTVKALVKIQRGFLWAGRADANGGNCHVNWQRVARPISLGGLGVRDLERSGLALRTCWLWFSRTDNARAWSGLDLQFSAEERDFFFASTTMQLGNGQQHRRKLRTVADGLQAHNWARDIHGVLGIQEVGQYLQLWHKIEHTTLYNEPDHLLWKWTASGTYTAQSAYKATFHGSMSCDAWKLTWKCWAPPRVRFFHWLAQLDRCWTADRLARRGLQHPPRCPLCDQEPETMHHLLLDCPFSRQVWHEALAWLRMPCHPPDGEESLNAWWTTARQTTPKLMRKGLASMTLLVPWMTWKHRNGCVFDRGPPRPLETQLAPYRRNIQDLLCDSGMIPYPEPFQSMYQKHRLGTLGIEWRPPSVHFAVGPTYDATTGEYQTIPVIDPDRWEPLPEITDFIELEPENEVISDDTDSEYNGMDDYSSEGEQEFWGGHSSGASYSSPEIDVSNHNSTANLRRSRRKKKRSDADLITSSDRRVTKRNLDGHSVATPSRPHRGRKSKTVRSTKRKRSPKYRGLRPQRRATHSTHSFFSNIKTSTEEEDGSASSLSDSGLNTESTEAEQSAWHGLPRLGRETNQYDSEDVTRPSQFTETKGKNSANSRKLILRMPRRDLKTQLPSESANPELPPHYRVLSLPAARYKDAEPELAFEPGSSSACKSEPALASGLHDVCTVHSNDAIKVGELKLRSSKQFKFGDSSSGDMWVSSNNALSQDVDGSGSHKTPHQYDNGIQQTVEQNIQKRQRAIYLDSIHENHNTDDYSEGHLPGKEWIADNKNTHLEEENNMEHKQQFHSTRSISFKLKLSRPRGFADGASSSDKSKTSAVGSDINYVKVSMQHDEASATSQHRSSGFPSVSRSFQDFESAKTYGAVCKMSEPSKHKTKLGSDAFGNEHSTSVSNDDGGHQPPDCSPIAPTGSLRRNKRRSRAYTDYGRGRGAISHVQSSSLEAATSGRRIVANVREVMWGSTSKTADIKSAMNKRESCHFPDTHLLEKKHQVSRYPWLMLLEHEDIYRYIPQLGDEVMYLRQGHEEYVNEVKSLENCPSNWIKSLKAAELCKIKGLDYKPDRGSGESCCELTIKFIDHTSSGFGKEFVITLRELVTFPDFLVERTWFEATTTYNWSVADRCKVWWMGVGEDGGSWWEGRVLDIRPRSPDFPESPWEKYIIQYENDGSEHPHSPWEVHDANNPLVSWKRPHIAPSTRNKLLSAVTGLQEKSLRNQDRYGVMKLDTAAGKSDFINRFPVQFSIEVIRARLQSDYYRTLEAVKHDVSVMLANAKSYFSNSCEMTKKIRKLSEWIQDKILSL